MKPNHDVKHQSGYVFSLEEHALKDSFCDWSGLNEWSSKI